ncbi:MAG: hypothetical protein KY475_15610 [Planctomycetes bacterium]|nr:hypothetical protein [Planctomycetota bacterium]
MIRALVLGILVLAPAGCAAVPDVVELPQYHNPFPQFHAVAVLPFANQSDLDPTVNGDQAAGFYVNHLQQIPGFEVVPVGVTKQAILRNDIILEGPPEAYRSELRRLGRILNVDVVVVGSITDFSPYYPPRMGLAVDWYAVNPCFHPIPPGYGLPWGTPEEEYIPDSLAQEAEFALAREQLKTQTPPNPEAKAVGNAATAESTESDVPSEFISDAVITGESGLPPGWPDPQGFIPPPPSSHPPACLPQHEPVISQVRQYNGHDAEFTQALAQHYYLQDDARFGGWQAYLQRSEDFMSFCCWLHIAEMLAARGGASETGVVLRWPLGRYER